MAITILKAGGKLKNETCYLFMKMYLLLSVLSIWALQVEAQTDRRPDADNVDAVKAWLRTEGITEPDTVLQYGVPDSAAKPFCLGKFSFDWEQAVWSLRISSTVVSQENWLEHHGTDPYDPEIDFRTRVRKEPEYKKTYGETSLIVVEVPVRSETRYRAVYSGNDGNTLRKDTVDVHPRIYYFINRDEPSYGYLSMRIPRSNDPALTDGTTYLANFCGVIVGIGFDGSIARIRREVPGHRVSMSARNFQAGKPLQTGTYFKYHEGSKDWDYVEIYRLTPSGEFEELVSKLK